MKRFVSVLVIVAMAMGLFSSVASAQVDDGYVANDWTKEYRRYEMPGGGGLYLKDPPPPPKPPRFSWSGVGRSIMKGLGWIATVTGAAAGVEWTVNKAKQVGGSVKSGMQSYAKVVSESWDQPFRTMQESNLGW